MPDLWRVLVVVPAGSPLGAAAVAVGWGCTAKLSPTGAAPATHFASCSIVDADELTALEGVFADGGPMDDATFYRWQVDAQGGDGPLVVSTSQTARPGSVWGVWACCSDLKVSRVITPLSAQVTTRDATTAPTITQDTPPAVAKSMVASLLAVVAASKIQAQAKG